MLHNTNTEMEHFQINENGNGPALITYLNRIDKKYESKVKRKKIWKVEIIFLCLWKFIKNSEKKKYDMGVLVMKATWRQMYQKKSREEELMDPLTYIRNSFRAYFMFYWNMAIFEYVDKF